MSRTLQLLACMCFAASACGARIAPPEGPQRLILNDDGHQQLRAALPIDRGTRGKSTRRKETVQLVGKLWNGASGTLNAESVPITSPRVSAAA